MAIHNALSLATAGAAILASSVAYAGTDGPLLEMTVLRNFQNPPAWNDFVEGDYQGGDIWFYQGVYEDPQGAWAIDYNVTYDTDPAVNFQMGFFNFMPTAETYSIIAEVPLDSPILGGTLMGGDVEGTIATGTITDTGSPVYNGLIDGSVELTLLDTLNMTGPGSIGPESAGLPGPTIPGPDATSTIAIRLDFELAAFSSVTFTANFVVEPVPAPGALALLGFAGLAGTRRRRRTA